MEPKDVMYSSIAKLLDALTKLVDAVTAQVNYGTTQKQSKGGV